MGLRVLRGMASRFRLAAGGAGPAAGWVALLDGGGALLEGKGGALLEGRRHPRRARSFLPWTRAAGCPRPFRRSLTSPGFGADPLSCPPVLGWILSHIPGFGWRLLDGWGLPWCAWSFFPWARAAGRPRPSPTLLHVPWVWGRILSHIPGFWGGSSLTSPGFGADPLSCPPGFGWRLGGALPRCAWSFLLWDARCGMPPPLPNALALPRVWGGSSLMSPGLRGGCCLDGGLPWCAWSFFPWARAARCPCTFRRSFTSPGVGGGSSLTSPGLGPDARSLPRGWVGGWSGGTFWGALGRSSFGCALSDVPAPSDALSLPPGLGAGPLSQPPGSGVDPLSRRVASHVLGVVLCDGVHGGLFLVFGGVL
ncbi:hypothetical protein J2790_003319, partial [Paenarthrobacter nicotinovorans]|nr:hypothetical protein [Paenarthrobacter nicotinovorans]